MSEAPSPSLSTLDRLEAHFPKHGVRDGVEYIKAADVVHRLNEVLGPWGWTHVELRDGYDEATDTVWSYGRLEGFIDGQPFAREQYGGQKVNRRTRGVPEGERGPVTDWANDKKGAKTDSLKKCAKEIGVAGYMDDPEERAEAHQEQTVARVAARRPAAAPTPITAAAPVVANGRVVDQRTGEVLVCADCRIELEVHRFANNATWSAAELARRSREKFAGKVYCFDHYKKRSDAKAQDAVSGNPKLKTAAGLRYPAEGG
jgi:hypothetical protein